MTTPKKSSKKLSVKVPDLQPKKDQKGGRDPASGLPTGKRMHKPFVIT
jgi:hypothetical protein